MVTAGVYLVIRCGELYSLIPEVGFAIASLGAFVAVFAASMALVNNDLKRIIAYSTLSQLGYMFLACGVGAFGAAMFHLMTHAFFKALMFLGSGSVIHAMHEEQDIRKMGGLKKYLPITHFTFFFGWVAIIGLPPFAGFFSKDEILWMAFSSPFGHKALWAVGALGAVITAFYMTRLMSLTFWGQSRVPKNIHPHESPWIMTVPLIVLGVLSVVGGWIGIPHVIGDVLGHVPNVLEHWFHPVIKALPEIEHAADTESLEWGLMGVSVALASISAMSAYYLYVKAPEKPEKIAKSLGGFYKLVYNKYFVDEFYFGFIINPIVNLGKTIWYYIDVNFIDKTTYVLADLVKGGGGLVRQLQTGNMQQYAMYVAIGIVITLSVVLMR
jgi:NADH-quinone oxidoreductase subunit L